MLGTLVNVCTIIVGSTFGAILKRKLDTRFQENLFNAMGICAVMVGISSCMNGVSSGGSLVQLIINMSLGCVLGTSLRLHDRFLGFTNKFSHSHNLGEGLVTASLLFCVGALSFLGPIQSALYNDNTLLFTNASLDFVTALAMATTYGIGIALVAIILFVYQGLIYLITLSLAQALPDYILNNITTTGGPLIVMSGICLLQLKNIKTTDFLPALLIAPITAIVANEFLNF